MTDSSDAGRMLVPPRGHSTSTPAAVLATTGALDRSAANVVHSLTRFEGGFGEQGFHKQDKAHVNFPENPGLIRGRKKAVAGVAGTHPLAFTVFQVGNRE